MTYKELMQRLKEEPVLFREGIRKELGNMPLSTYYKKAGAGKFTPDEKEAIAKHLGKPARELFPGRHGRKRETHSPETGTGGAKIAAGQATYQETYRQKKVAYANTRDAIMQTLGNMSLSAYYIKLEKTGFAPAEKAKISRYLKMPAKELFPETEKGQDGAVQNCFLDNN